MLDVAPTELLLVAFVALVVIGPKDLPKAMRVVGHWLGRARGIARQFRSGFDTMVREAELEEMEKRWAAENARIMEEHGVGASAGRATADPVPDAASFDDPGTHDPFGVEPEPALAEKPAVARDAATTRSDGSPS